MPQFDYDAVDPAYAGNVGRLSSALDPESLVRELSKFTRVHNGIIQAGSPEEAVNIIESRGMIPVRMTLITHDQEGLIRLSKLKERRNDIMDLNAPPPVHIRPKQKIQWSNLVPWIIGIGVLLAGLLSWFFQ